MIYMRNSDYDYSRRHPGNDDMDMRSQIMDILNFWVD